MYSNAASNTADVLRRVWDKATVVEDFCRLADCLEWRLGRAFYRTQGTVAFRGESNYVTFEITNDGRLSHRAAKLLFAAIHSRRDDRSNGDKFYVLEIGVGTGLFARILLDAFAQLCVEAGVTYHRDVVFVAVDCSAKMLCEFAASEVMTGHASCIRTIEWDAAGAEGLRDILPTQKVEAVFLNYVLDSLPSTVLRKCSGQWNEVWFQTVLARFGVPGMSDNQVSELVQQLRHDPTGDALRKAIVLQPWLCVREEERPCNVEAMPYGLEVLRLNDAMGPCEVVVNHGAYDLLKELRTLMAASGFIAIADYGTERASQGLSYQRFAGAVSVGVNFDLLSAVVSGELKWLSVAPAEFNGLIHCRLLTDPGNRAMHDLFKDIYSKEAFEREQQPVQKARRCIEAGSLEEAIAAYAAALELQPSNWSLMEEVSRFAMAKLGEYECAEAYARAGLQINPCFSAHLWCTLADAVSKRNRDEAQLCLERAVVVDPTCVRARLGFARLHNQRGQVEQCLYRVAEGLHLDLQGEYRERLLAEQQEAIKQVTRERDMKELVKRNRQVFSSRHSSASATDHLHPG